MVSTPLDDLRAVAEVLRGVNLAWAHDLAGEVDAAVAALAPKTLPEVGDDTIVTPETVEPLIYEHLVGEKTEGRS